VTVVVVLAGLEGVSRLFDDEPPSRPVASYITVWDDGEFYTVKSAATGWPPWEDYNRDGMRDREHAVEGQPGVRRVMVLGDSVTLGYGLRPEQAFPQVLQDLLDARGRQAEVFNVAFSGWSTRQERIAYERIGRRYRPDDVVVAICLNDIPEIHNNLARPPRLLQALHARSALVRRLVGAQRREIHDVEELFTRPDAPNVKDAFARFFEELRRLRSEVEADGGRFGLAVLPFRMQLASADPPTVQERIAAFGAAEKVPVVDLLPSLRTMGESAFLDYDHLSAAGARRVAEVLADSMLLGTVRDEHVPTERAAEVKAPSAGAPGVPPLARLRDPDPSIRAATARALGNAGADTASVVPALAHALTDREPAVRAAAAWALGGFGAEASPAVPQLTDALADETPAVRAGAAHTLGAIGPGARSAASALVPRLGDAAEEVRWRAEDALARVGPDPASTLPALLPLLADPNGPGRGGAASVIARMGPAARSAMPALLAALSDARGAVRWKAAWALGQIGPEARAAVPALTALVRDPDAGWHAIDALGAIGPDARSAVPTLRSALRDASSNVRWRAALALSHIGTEAAAAAPELTALLADPVDNVRLAAVNALSRVAPEEAAIVPPLADALRRDGDSRVRAAAALALGRRSAGGSVARDGLLEATRDPDALVRASAVRALGRDPSSPEAAAALARALGDPDPGVRAEAARAAKGRRR
jgi:HEAT repeat protein/lysophospholipase L1-like esterase